MAKQHGLYDESPEIKHDMEGNTRVEKKAKGDGATDKGVKEEGFPVHIKHAHERQEMHARHEHEHHMHDHHHGVGGKEEMHARHEAETKAMHTRHEKEAGAHGGAEAGAGGATKEPLERIEKGAKS